MTDQQLQALKSSILADPALAGYVSSADDVAIAAAYNAVASPDYWVKRTRVDKTEIYSVTTSSGTTWSWPALIARSQGERDGWRELFSSGYVNPSLPNVTQAVADIFSGTANNAPQQRAHLLAISRRLATRFEVLFVSGGDGTTANPSVMAIEGPVSYAEISRALRG